ncbi:MAG: flap endonuclease-1 [Candidatus Aenigmarchaeota archaeon]|nr:flap endonuclease-1 [Candidatus Aenigmarchaeota archaeon]
MGVQLNQIIPKRKINLEFLSNKKIAIDAFNMIFQFLSTIRQRETGEPLKDSKGNVTSHLSGLFYRNIRFLENNIKPIYVFDGSPPEFKRKTIMEREKRKEEAMKKLEQALKEGRIEDVMLYAQQTSQLTDEMIEESKKLLDALGIPWVQAKSEGEAQACYLVENNDAYAVGSQDYDSLLFGAKKLVRNMSATGRKRFVRGMWIEIEPEIIELDEVLKELGINRNQLIIVGILIGTDYNPGGVKGIGPKNALKLVKQEKTLDKVLKKIDWDFDIDAEEIYNFFLNPPIEKKYKIEYKQPDRDKIIKLLVQEHDFSEKRVENNIDKLLQAKKQESQSTLGNWLKH